MARIRNSRSSNRRAPAATIETRPRKRAIQERSRATVDVILRATARVLVRVGYDHASTNKVAAEAGVSVGSLYQYFPSKEALVAALVDRHVTETMGAVRAEAPALFAMPVERAVRRFVEMMIDVHRIDPALHRVLCEQLPRVGDLDKIHQVEREGEALARAYLTAHRDEVEPEDLDMAAFILVHTVEALTHAAVLLRPELLNRPELVDEVTSVVVRYLQPSKHRRES